MSLGSRIAKRGKAAVFASLASTPREPLLFLYPSWNRASSTSTHDETSTTQHPTTTGRKLRPATLEDGPVALERRFNGSKAALKIDQFEAPDEFVPSKARAPNLTTADGILSLEREQTKLKFVKAISPAEIRVRKVVSARKNTKQSEESARGVRKAYQNFKREELAAWLPDWRVVLSTLRKHTPKHGKWLSRVLKFVIPASSARRLLFGLDDNFHDIAQAHGCVIEIGAREDDSGDYRTLVVSGSATAISKCAADILRISPGVQIVPTGNLIPDGNLNAVGDGSEESSGVVVFDSGVRIRNVSSDHRLPKAILRPGDIPRPAEWTQPELLDYIRKLRASSQMTSHVNRMGFGREQDHRTVSSELIRKLFTDPECKSSMSREAFHEAMEHFISINRIEDVRILFVRMDMMKLNMTPETFNIMLAGAAKSEDFHNFHFILHLMLDRGCLPNGRTWTSFMNATSDARIKLHILSAMQQHGLLNHIPTMREVCAQLAYSEAESSLDLNQNQDEFVAHMDSRYGVEWFSVDSANRILHALGARGLISRCWEFLYFMESRSVVPDRYSVNLILHFCKQSSNLSGAVELLRSLPKSVNFVEDDETYRILFELAWRSRSYNVARVIWRYACLAASTSFRMRQRVFGSMKESNRVDPPKTARERWERYAGPAIIGGWSQHPQRCYDHIFGDVTGHAAMGKKKRNKKMSRSSHPTDTLSEPDHTEPTDAISQTTESPWATTWHGKRFPSHKAPILIELLNADLSMFKTWKPVKSLSLTLADALELDTKWKCREDYREHTLEWLLDGRCKYVRLHAKTGPIERIYWK